jgi:hypothetical protein
MIAIRCSRNTYKTALVIFGIIIKGSHVLIWRYLKIDIPYLSGAEPAVRRSFNRVAEVCLNEERRMRLNAFMVERQY